MRDAFPQGDGRPRLTACVVGVGNALRGDDAAGLVVARGLAERLGDAVRVVENAGNGAALLDALDGVELAFVVDACTSGAPPGTVTVYEAHDRALPAALDAGSTHGFGLAHAVELGRALGRLPERLFVVTIEGADYSEGSSLSPDVASGVRRAIDIVADLR